MLDCSKRTDQDCLLLAILLVIDCATYCREWLRLAGPPVVNTFVFAGLSQLERHVVSRVVLGSPSNMCLTTEAKSSLDTNSFVIPSLDCI